jgi:hypothetical protein
MVACAPGNPARPQVIVIDVTDTKEDETLAGMRGDARRDFSEERQETPGEQEEASCPSTLAATQSDTYHDAQKQDDSFCSWSSNAGVTEPDANGYDSQADEEFAESIRQAKRESEAFARAQGLDPDQVGNFDPSARGHHEDMSEVSDAPQATQM